MHNGMRHVFAASLLASTAIVPAAMAQDDSCAELNQVIQDNQDRFEQQWLDQATGIFEQGDAEVCTAWVDAANRAIEGSEAEPGAEGAAVQTEEGRIVVDMPEPTVTVDQPAPEVTVMQPDPNVTVRQAQPQIIVRQAEPTVTVQMPQPTITIDQPPPEIIVRMPEPEISVDTPQPQVEVSQAQPTVQVEQGQPEVEVEQGEADVQVEGGQPVVQLQDTEGQAEVDLQQAEGAPEITYEAAEPRVQVEMTGEPQVQFSESGEPNVRIERAGEETEGAQDPAAGAEPETLMEEDPAAETAAASDWRGDRELLVAPVIEREGFVPAIPETISLEDISNASVYGVNDEEIAEVGDVIVDDTGQIEYFIMDVGGFLGIGSREVAVGFDEVTVLQEESSGEYRVFVEATEQQLEELPEYQEA